MMVKAFANVGYEKGTGEITLSVPPAVEKAVLIITNAKGKLLKKGIVDLDFIDGKYSCNISEITAGYDGDIRIMLWDSLDKLTPFIRKMDI